MSCEFVNSGRFGGPRPSIFNRTGGMYAGAGGISQSEILTKPGAARKIPQDFQAPTPRNPIIP